VKFAFGMILLRKILLRNVTFGSEAALQKAEFRLFSAIIRSCAVPEFSRNKKSLDF
jgi:hypothetical protein